MSRDDDSEVDDLLDELDRELDDLFKGTGGPGESRQVDDHLGDCRLRERPLQRHEGAWDEALLRLPRKVADILGSFRVVPLRLEALEDVERELFRWRERPSLGVAREAWRSAMRRPQRTSTLKVVRRAVHETKRLAQSKKLVEHECARTLAEWQRDPQVRDGVLVVRDVPPGIRSFGLRSYLEATPIEAVALVARLWEARTGRKCPACWDLTAGSSTVADVVGRIFGGKVVSTDIMNQGKVAYGDARDVGRLTCHGARTAPGEAGPPIVVARPDLVYLHPPSPGGPAVCTIFDGEAAPVERDLGVLAIREGKDAYVAVLAEVIGAVLPRLAPEGLVSALIPEYLRAEGEVLTDPGTADALLEALEGAGAGFSLVERHAVSDRTRVPQTSLGRQRGPMIHLIIEASSTPPRKKDRAPRIPREDLLVRIQ